MNVKQALAKCLSPFHVPDWVSVWTLEEVAREKVDDIRMKKKKKNKRKGPKLFREDWGRGKNLVLGVEALCPHLALSGTSCVM